MNKKQILSYEELYEAYLIASQERYKYKEVIDKIKEIVDKAPCLWRVDEEFERVDGTIELSYKEYTGWKNILELLEEIE